MDPSGRVDEAFQWTRARLKSIFIYNQDFDRAAIELLTDNQLSQQKFSALLAKCDPIPVSHDSELPREL